MAAPKKMRAKSIGHYILGKTIGEGTFGKVKLGTHILTGEKVAVKILEKERIVDVADVERVAREIHILKLIQHPHVIQLYEIIETPKQLYLIMEYCSGGELFDHIVASGRVRERDACRFFHQIVAGLEQIHRMGVVHRDLKPENLLLDEQRGIKIVDFGLSNTFQEGQLLKTACGSPCYAAPEMIAGHRYVPHLCDLWSCGVILFALVCGYLPFEDQNTANLYRKILNAEYQAPNFISDSVRELIAKMLTTDPEHRYTVPRIRQHIWYRQIPEAAVRWDGERGERVLDEDVLEQLDRFGFPRDYAVKCLQMNKHNHVTTTYYLLCEKNRRLPCRSAQLQEATLAADFSRGCGQRNEEVELLAEAPTPEVGMENEQAIMPKGMDLAHQNAPVDAADRAGGGYAAPCSPKEEKILDDTGPPGNYNQWAQALMMPSQSGHREVSPNAAVPNSPMAYAGQSPRSSNGPRRHSENANTPRGLPTPTGSGQVLQGSAQASPRKRSPIQQSTGMATPRGPVPTAPHMGTASRSGVYTRADGSSMGTPIGVRTSTPGRRPPGVTSASTEGQLSARGQPSARPSTSQGMATPSRPSGSATGRGPNEARRRQFTGVNDSAPNSARTGRAVGSTAGSGHAAATALAEQTAPGNRSVGHPVPAWASRQPVGRTPSYGSGARASSVSPEMSPPVDSSNVSPGPMANPPLSARDARDDVMRTCRGAFNVSCTSSKHPKQILQEIQRALTLQRVSHKQCSNFLVKCQRQNLRFEMEISHLDHLESIYVVRFKRVAGELVSYKELCSKILAEMKI